MSSKLNLKACIRLSNSEDRLGKCFWIPENDAMEKVLQIGFTPKSGNDIPRW